MPQGDQSTGGQGTAAGDAAEAVDGGRSGLAEGKPQPGPCGGTGGVALGREAVSWYQSVGWSTRGRGAATTGTGRKRGGDAWGVAGEMDAADRFHSQMLRSGWGQVETAGRAGGNCCDMLLNVGGGGHARSGEGALRGGCPAHDAAGAGDGGGLRSGSAMYGFSADDAWGVLVGRELLQVCVGAHHVRLIFDSETELGVEGRYEAGSGEAEGATQQGSPSDRLLRLVERRVVAVSIEGPQAIRIGFASDGWLKIHDDRAGYEAAELRAPGVHIIV